jgi:hypothetical protein
LTQDIVHRCYRINSTTFYHRWVEFLAEKFQ